MSLAWILVIDTIALGVFMFVVYQSAEWIYKNRKN